MNKRIRKFKFETFFFSGILLGEGSIDPLLSIASRKLRWRPTAVAATPTNYSAVSITFVTEGTATATATTPAIVIVIVFH